ncbi:MAG: hypothetical protein ACQCN6_01690 [Candidatus Bathyarchaeia archaeon]|jgi:hypothetical protein
MKPHPTTLAAHIKEVCKKFDLKNVSRIDFDVPIFMRGGKVYVDKESGPSRVKFSVARKMELVNA